MNIAKRFYYGWVVVFAGVLLTALSLGMFFSTNSLFVVPVCDTFGFSRAAFTLHRTLITLTGALLMPFYGRLIQKIGVKKVMLACALMLSLSTIGYSFSTRLWHFYFLAFINGMFVNGISFMSVGVLISAWFNAKQGLPLGLAYSGSGLGGAITVPIVAGIIELSGWQWAYRIMGIAGLIVMLPIIYFLVKNKPEDIGLESFTPQEFKDESKHDISNNLTISKAFRTSKFWMLTGAFFLITSFAAATNTHTAPYLSDLGYSTIFISSIVSVFMLFLTAGKIILGFIYDRFGALIANLLISVFCLGFPLFALLSYIPAMAWAYAVFIGMASCAVSISVPILIKRYFGSKDFASIFSFCSMIATFAASISVPTMGAVFDATSSYRPAWIVFFITSVVITILLVGGELLHRKEQTSAILMNRKL